MAQRRQAPATTGLSVGVLRTIELLKALPLFAGLGADELIPIATSVTAEEFAEGETIFREGDPGLSLFIVNEGTVEILLGTRVIAELHQGDCLGELAIIDRAPRSAGARAKTELSMLAISADDFEELLDSYPTLGRALLSVLAERVLASRRD